MIQRQEQLVGVRNIQCYFEEMICLRDRIARAYEMISAIQQPVLASGIPPSLIGLVGETLALRGLVDDSKNTERFHSVPVPHIVMMRQIHDNRIELHGSTLPR